MSEEFNKSIVRRIWKEIWQEGNLAIVDELIDNHDYPLISKNFPIIV